MSSENTPMMQQYYEIKRGLNDTLLFYRMGDFYEMFGDDAVTASRVLGITLTTRDKGKANPLPMCGVPHHSSSGYIARLIKAGFKVAVCEQTADPSECKGLVPREVVQVITPGLISEENHLDRQRANYLMAVASDGQRYGIAFVDISTGDFRATELNNRLDFVNEIGRVSPSEIFTTEPGLAPDNYFVTLEDRPLKQTEAAASLSAHFGVHGIDGLGLGEYPAALKAAALALNYVRETQKSAMAHLSRLRYYNPGNYLLLGAGTRRNLELFDSIAGERSGTLYYVLNQTVTAMGARKLADWLNFPLMELAAIDARLDAVAELVAAGETLAVLREQLDGVPDLERIIGRVATLKASPRDVVALAEGLEQVPFVKQTLTGLGAGLLAELDAGLSGLPEMVGRIRATVVDEPPLKLADCGVIRPGVDAELDELRSLRRDSRQWIADLEAKEKQTTGLNTLKIGYNRVFGYYIEISKAAAASAPENYIRKQTLANAERFITPELKEYEAKLLGAEGAIEAIEKRIFNDLREALLAAVPDLQATAAALSALDALGSLAYLARQNGYRRPVLKSDRSLAIVNGRHPVVEQVLAAGQFVPNSCHFDAEHDNLHVITGPNMAGKSTFMRQAALVTIMAQMGSFVPAELAEIGLVDRIFTRIGALDNLSAGQSTFMVEMAETADILNNATAQSLVILDEIGRGTSTYDGMALAWAVAEYLDERRVRTFFATHYHELADLARRRPGIKNYHMAVEENGHEVIFLRELKRGATGKSYGIHVAKLAGIPAEVVANARLILESIGRKGKCVPRVAAETAVQASLFAEPETEPAQDDELKAAVLGLDLEELKPIEALNFLYDLKRRLLEG